MRSKMESVTQWLTPNRKSNGLQAARERESPYLLLSVCFNSAFFVQNLVESILSCSSNRLLFFFGDHSVLSHVDASLMQPVPKQRKLSSVRDVLPLKQRWLIEVGNHWKNLNNRFFQAQTSQMILTVRTPHLSMVT